MIMGRKTFESFPKPLPGRRHIVLTRDPDWHAEGAEVVHTVEEALLSAGDGDVAIIGGAQIYAMFLPLAQRIELTQIHASIDGDTHMDEPGEDWVEISRDEQPAQDTRPAFAWVTYERGL